MANIVVACFFPAFRPASSGGELRLGKLYEALAKFHTITLLTSTDFGARFEEIIHAANFREMRFPKDDLWRNAYATLEKSGVSGDLAGLAFSLAVSEPTCRLRVMARELAEKADFFIHEFPFSEPIFNDRCPCREIYNSHNFEASLLSSIVRGAGFETSILKLIRIEGNLVRRAYRVFATSAGDAEKFRVFYGADETKLALCPNGFNPSDLNAVLKSRSAKVEVHRIPRLLFTGSAHYPNVEAASFLLTIASDLPDCEIILAGGLSSAIDANVVGANVRIMGPFDDAKKHTLLATADIFLNPVNLGSGTSLKALEALGVGIPMVSTEEGVRGLGVQPGKHCSIVARGGFVNAIKDILANYGVARIAADEGSKFAAEHFSWSKIALDFSQVLESPIPKVTSAKSLILAFNDYSVMHEASGGTARVRNVLANVGVDVILISFGESFEVAFISTPVLHVTVPKTAAHSEFEWALTDGQPMSVNDAAASLFVNSNRVLGDLTADFLRRSRAVVFEHPYMAPILDIIDSIQPDIPIIYSAHNFETTHKEEILRRHSIGRKLTEFIADLESRLIDRAKLIVACTEADATVFREMNPATLVVKNGCSIMAPALLERREKNKRGVQNRVGFLGSGHGPNVEAAQFIVEELAPLLPHVTFDLVGSVCGSLSALLPVNVVLHGTVSEDEKSRIMLAWDVALNPILSGGGSSLKLPDYLAHGLPTISTDTGARGFETCGGGVGRIVSRARFGLELGYMLAHPEILELEGKRAYACALRELSWVVVTDMYREMLKRLMREPQTIRPMSKLLVVTYRYNEPPLGGAEEYLIEVLKRLRRNFERIDLATVNIESLTNRFHFGCRYSKLDGGQTLRIGEIFDRTEFLPTSELADSEMLELAREIERGWRLEDKKVFAHFARVLREPNELRVFGGFFGPENHAGLTRRWTSPEFSFLLPQSAHIFQMKGYAAQRKRLKVSLMRVDQDEKLVQQAQYQVDLDPHFNLNLRLPAQISEHVMVLVLEVDEHQATGDHRPFGVLLEWAAVLRDEQDGFAVGSREVGGMEMSVANLSELHEEEIRTRFFKEWTRVLRQNVVDRDDSMEAAFASIRGPRSPALCDWVETNASNYDVVLVQGMPFDTIPGVVETLEKFPARPRLVTLPHFHGDDRFYYWKRYLEAFANSDSNILFSQSIADSLGGAKYAIVPGGGIRPDEHADTNASKHFREIYANEQPFFLVLGRKTESKGYDRVIRAHQSLKQQGIDCGLVLIGPDEDGLPVVSDGATYLGRQPRQIVRGALTSCRGLITMSQSESFGIVLCEAWLFGKPVIANRACYSFRELVRHEETGLLVSTESELISAMLRLLLEPMVAARMGNMGFGMALEYFGWDNVAQGCFLQLAPRDHLDPAFGVSGNGLMYAQ